MAWVAEMQELLEEEGDSFPGYDKVHGLLVTLQEELPDVPLYWSLHDLCSTLRCSAPPLPLLKSALINAGFRASQSHANPLAVKTDAPAGVVWDVLRCWVQEHPVKERDGDTSPGSVILSKPPARAHRTPVSQAPTQPQQHSSAIARARAS